jgi:hypothetical protein
MRGEWRQDPDRADPECVRILLAAAGQRRIAARGERESAACQGFLDSGRLFLTVDPQTYELATSTHFDCGNGAGPRFANDTETGTWTLEGGPETFTITFTPNGASFHHLTTATINTTAVTIRLDAPHQDAGNPNFSVTTFWRKQ